MEAVAPAERNPRWTTKRGYDVLRDPALNKGLAFTLEERQQLNIHGLLPPCFFSQDMQVLIELKKFERQATDLDRYILLMGLQDLNEKLFYKVLTSDIERFMPIVYTPTVGLACQQYGIAFQRPRGLFITSHDRGHIETLFKAWPETNIKAIVVTDGERILGLGDLGCYGMGIPVGKLALYTACGGVKPQECLPIMLDVGTDNEELINDPLYIGLKHKRIRGQAYDDLLDEFMEAAVSRYGRNCLIQFEDFANQNAFRLLNKYRNLYCTFNDDIQGTASIAVAGLLAALQITQNKLSDHTILFQGAGEAAMGIASLLIMGMEKEGTPKKEAIKKIWLVDSKGLIVKGRVSLTSEKEVFAHQHEEMKNLEDIVNKIRPSVLIGVAAIAGAFTKNIIKNMASLNKRPIIFALSNPTSKAECSAEDCYYLTEGRGIFASGSPFDPVTLPDGHKFYPGQGNNAYVFPGIALGVVSCGVRNISDDIFLLTAEVICKQVSKKHLDEGRLYPPLVSIRDVSLKIAAKKQLPWLWRTIQLMKSQLNSSTLSNISITKACKFYPTGQITVKGSVKCSTDLIQLEHKQMESQPQIFGFWCSLTNFFTPWALFIFHFLQACQFFYSCFVVISKELQAHLVIILKLVVIFNPLQLDNADIFNI